MNLTTYKIVLRFVSGSEYIISRTNDTSSSSLIPCNAMILLYMEYGTTGSDSLVKSFLITPATAYPQ